MESIFKCNNLRFSLEMFCHMSVIKDDCCVVAYGCFFLPEHLQVSGAGQTESPALSPDSKLTSNQRRIDVSRGVETTLISDVDPASFCSSG